MARAVSWLRENFSETMKVEDLADMAHMSASSFHQHFEAVTSMSPLHYQKTLRLQEARCLMLWKMMDAGIASRDVGYASASQFSREYGRFFGIPPAKDITRLREQVGGAAVEQELTGPPGASSRYYLLFGGPALAGDHGLPDRDAKH
jgi:transcriptional regulator GlxA family with amidase domain